jgi:hypothetical protein
MKQRLIGRQKRGKIKAPVPIEKTRAGTIIV